MTTLAKHMIVVGADNRPPMLEKSMYNSWSSRILLYIKGKEHGRIMLNSVLKGPLVYGTIEVNGVTRLKTYEELSDKEKLDDCDLRAMNIVLQGMTMRPVQVNTKFLNSLPLEWSKFVIDVKLAKDMHEANYDQLYAYLSQHEAHAIEIESGLAVPSFLPGDDPIPSLNKAMEFLTTAVEENSFHTKDEQERESRERKQKRKIEWLIELCEITKRTNTLSVSREAVQARVVRCYNCQGERHMERQCTQPKMRRNSAWFKEKILLVQLQESGQTLDEEQLAFLADPGVAKSQITQTTMTHNAAFQTDDLDAFDSDCDKAPGAKVVVTANLSSWDSDVISETENVAVQHTTSTKKENDVILLEFEEITNIVTQCIAESLKHKNVNESLTVELERYKERVKMVKERQKVDLNEREKYIDSQANDMILNKNAKFAAFEK
nr:hypothetical protein [Tanacetum cinerariifolium]